MINYSIQITQVKHYINKEKHFGIVILKLTCGVNRYIKTSCTDCPKKLQLTFGYRLRKNPLWNLKNQTRL